MSLLLSCLAQPLEEPQPRPLGGEPENASLAASREVLQIGEACPEKEKDRGRVGDGSAQAARLGGQGTSSPGCTARPHRVVHAEREQVQHVRPQLLSSDPSESLSATKSASYLLLSVRIISRLACSKGFRRRAAGDLRPYQFRRVVLDQVLGRSRKYQIQPRLRICRWAECGAKTVQTQCGCLDGLLV